MRLHLSILIACLGLAATNCFSQNECDSNDFACRPEAGILVYLKALEDQSEEYRAMILDEANLVAYWRLEETSGTTADELKNDFDGAYENGVSLGRDGAIYGDDLAPAFDGVDDVVTVAHQTRFNFAASERFSVEAWIKVEDPQSDTGSADNALIGKGAGGAAYPFALRYDNQNGRVGFLRSDGTNTPLVENSFALNTGVFYHIVAVHDGELKLYVNGELRGRADENTTGDTTNTSTLTFGRRSGGDRPLTGALDEIAIYDAALAADRILYHYRFGVGLVTSI